MGTVAGASSRQRDAFLECCKRGVRIIGEPCSARVGERECEHGGIRGRASDFELGVGFSAGGLGVAETQVKQGCEAVQRCMAIARRVQRVECCVSFVEKFDGFGGLSLAVSRRTENEVAPSDGSWVVGDEIQCFTCEAFSVIEVIAKHEPVRRLVEDSPTSGQSGRTCSRQQEISPSSDIPSSAVRVGAQGDDDPEGQVCVGLFRGVQTPTQHGTEVVKVRLDSSRPRKLVRTGEIGAGTFAEARVILGVAAAPAV